MGRLGADLEEKQEPRVASLAEAQKPRRQRVMHEVTRARLDTGRDREADPHDLASRWSGRRNAAIHSGSSPALASSSSSAFASFWSVRRCRSLAQLLLQVLAID